MQTGGVMEKGFFNKIQFPDLTLLPDDFVSPTTA